MDRMAKLAGHGDGSLVMGAGAAGLSQVWSVVTIMTIFHDNPFCSSAAFTLVNPTHGWPYSPHAVGPPYFCCPSERVKNCLIVYTWHVSKLNGHIGELVPSFVLGGDNHTKSCRVGMDREAIIEKDTTLKCGKKLSVHTFIHRCRLRFLAYRIAINHSWHSYLLLGGISNLYVCEGKPDKVIYLEAAKRTGSQISLPQVGKA